MWRHWSPLWTNPAAMALACALPKTRPLACTGYSVVAAWGGREYGREGERKGGREYRRQYTREGGREGVQEGLQKGPKQLIDTRILVSSVCGLVNTDMLCTRTVCFTHLHMLFLQTPCIELRSAGRRRSWDGCIRTVSKSGLREGASMRQGT